MSANIQGLFSIRWIHVTTKVTLALLGVATCAFFFGLVLPVLLLGFGILPNMGLGSVVYFYGGAVLGFLSGAISFSVSLARTHGIISPYYAYAMGVMLVVSIFSIMGSMHLERFSHL